MNLRRTVGRWLTDAHRIRRYSRNITLHSASAATLAAAGSAETHRFRSGFRATTPRKRFHGKSQHDARRARLHSIDIAGVPAGSRADRPFTARLAAGGP